MAMSGEEVVEILNEELVELIDSLASGVEESYTEIKQIISEDEHPDDAMEAMKELVEIMVDSGRIGRQKGDEIIRRLEE